jgi:hypothetical protein
MHSYSDLINRCTIFTIGTLKEVNDKTIESLQTSGATVLVKTLQMIQLQKTILVIGMFSLYESILQEALNCKNGFTEAKQILQKGDNALVFEDFTDLELAVNVLKHGKGRSYDSLISKNGGTLQNYIKELDDNWEEGDVSEIDTLIKVDDDFILHCSETIEKVSKIINTFKPDIYL